MNSEFRMYQSISTAHNNKRIKFFVDNDRAVIFLFKNSGLCANAWFNNVNTTVTGAYLSKFIHAASVRGDTVHVRVVRNQSSCQCKVKIVFLFPSYFRTIRVVLLLYSTSTGDAPLLSWIDSSSKTNCMQGHTPPSFGLSELSGPSVGVRAGLTDIWTKAADCEVELKTWEASSQLSPLYHCSLGTMIYDIYRFIEENTNIVL